MPNQSVGELPSPLLQRVSNAKELCFSGLANASAKAFFVSKLLETHPGCFLWVAEDSSMAERIANDLAILTEHPVIPILVNEDEKAGERVSELGIHHAISLLATDQPGVVITDEDSLSEIQTPTINTINRYTLSLQDGHTLNLIDLFNRLIDIGYEACEGKVQNQGDYVRRGSVVDIFPINSINPIRIDVGEGKLSEIILFNQYTGAMIRKLSKRDKADIYPIKTKPDTKSGQLFDYLNGCTLILDEVSDRVIELAKNRKVKRTLTFMPFLDQKAGAIHLNFNSLLRYNSPLDFAKDARKKVDSGWKILVFTKDKERIWNFLIDQKFTDNDFRSLAIFGNGHMEIWKDAEKQLYLPRTRLLLPEAFSNPDLRVQVVTEKEIFGAYLKEARQTKEQADAAFLATLNEEDLVVHIDHGIGRFKGLEQKNFDGVTREYLHIEYANNDRLYVLVDQAEKVNKYIGAGMSSNPPLTRLGSAEWSTVAKRVRVETQQIAKELLELYAKRQLVKGFAYKKEGDALSRFESLFPYIETPGQLRAINEIKQDMGRGVPMDRLLCGDVGFGKTEIAMRAAFKAVINGKQVAFLAPITILADQHYKTLAKRMNDFSLRVELLSRFRTPSEQVRILKDLKDGKIDVVVGTHRLLQDDVKFKDLGLIIVDEEQRFGVKQKEKLKQLRLGVDILTLTATPIPRTLNMGLSGLRDISTITTPPPGRLPIHTEVRRFSYHLIKEAIERELERDGQVFFLHNRVQTIESAAEKIRSVVPQARILVAHGKLPPQDLEERIMAFKHGEYNVLVSSTIIENGIDLPNANTLIVDRTENLGLAQAYQLRGRVGRSKRQAYAYLLYQTQRLKPDAKKRLKAIIEASELGSGFQIAMRDLEIRGAGEILGAKQHGAINAVGVSHFTRLLKRAVEEFKANKVMKKFQEEIPEVTVDLNITAYVPDEYIKETGLKLKYYQRLSGVKDFTTLNEVLDEIRENFGKLPWEAENLIKIIGLKILAKAALVATIEEFRLDGERVIDVILSSQVTPKAISGLLNHNDKWQITGSKLRIKKEQLGEKWLDELTDCVRCLIIQRGWKKEKELLAPVKEELEKER